VTGKKSTAPRVVPGAFTYVAAFAIVSVTLSRSSVGAPLTGVPARIRLPATMPPSGALPIPTPVPST